MDHNLRKKLRSHVSTIFTIFEQMADVESKYNVVKHVVKHLKMFVEFEKKKTVANIKVYPVYI